MTDPISNTLFKLTYFDENGAMSPCDLESSMGDLYWRFADKAEIHLRSEPATVIDGILQKPFRLEVVPLDDFCGVFLLEMSLDGNGRPFYLIPGVLYGTNNLAHSSGRQPQLAWRGLEEYPRTPVFQTRIDRSSHGLVMAYQGQQWTALRMDEVGRDSNGSWSYNGLSVDTQKTVGDHLGVSLGYRHYPVLYRGKLGRDSNTLGPVVGPVSFQRGKMWSVFGEVYSLEKAVRADFGRILRVVYRRIHQPPNHRMPRHKVVEALTEALVGDGYLMDWHYFPTVVSETPEDEESNGDVGWTGGMQVAYPLLRAGAWSPAAETIAVDYIEHLLSEGIHPGSGLFYESKNQENWKMEGWWTPLLNLCDPETGKTVAAAHSAYINGQASCYLLKSAAWREVSRNGGADAVRWRDVVLGVLRGVLPQQRADGAMPTFLRSDDGRAISHEGFQGAWFMAAAAEAALTEPSGPWLEAAERAASYYLEWLDTLEPWGTPLDTGGAVDEEGNLALITGLCTLHRLTGKQIWLDGLLRALDFECSWKFAYNTHFEHEPLKSLGWPSCGGSITSTHNIHIHPMGNLVVEEFYYAVKLTGDPYLESRLRDTLNWGYGIFNRFDGEFGFGKRGWATEQFFHSDAIRDDLSRKPDGGIWPAFIPWAASCALLSTCAAIPAEYYVVDDD